MPGVGFNQPFGLQVEFLKAKLQLPTERWTDIWQSAHDRAFVVAGATRADLLNDLHLAVIKAAEQGLGLEAFRKDFNAIVARNGWTGWTGQGTEAGEAWRTRVIYQTNMATSYAAGRWQQLKDPDLLSLRPYWKYHHLDGVLHPRPQHVSWNGLVLPHDHPFWKTHYPPNGWGCHCWVTAVGQDEYDKAVAAGKAGPPAGWAAINPRTGAPVGIDKGWAYAPGANAQTELKDLVEQKLFKLDARIGSAMWAELQPAIFNEMASAYRAWLGAIATDNTAKSITPVVGAVSEDVLSALAGAGLSLPSTAEIVVNSGIINGGKADRHEKSGNAIPLDIWGELPEMLANPLAVLYDTVTEKLLYVMAGGQDKRTKIVVRFDFATKGVTRNMIVSGYQPFAKDLRDRINNNTLLQLLGSVDGV